MRKASACIVVTLSVAACGCVMSAKNAKTVTPAPIVTKPAAPPPPAPPPEPLSVTQTQVELPRPQALDPAALSADTPVQVEPPPAPTPSRPSTTRRPPRTETAPPATPPATPAEAAPAIREIIPPAESKRLQEQAQMRRREVLGILDQLTHRNLSNAERDVVTRINGFLNDSLDAEKKNDMKLADALADRAQVLAKDLINAK
jgi:hypothetical protein